MPNKKFEYDVQLVPLSVENASQDIFRERLNALPYLLYEVEQLKNGHKIVINKPGGKRNFGRLSRNDFMVFIFSPEENSLWLISHSEILEALELKYQQDREKTLDLITLMLWVCDGEEPNSLLNKYTLDDICGIPSEAILKAYKWIWGQEDCNYPTKQGRWLSMNAILEHFQLSREQLCQRKK